MLKFEKVKESRYNVIYKDLIIGSIFRHTNYLWYYDLKYDKLELDGKSQYINDIMEIIKNNFKGEIKNEKIWNGLWRK